MSIVNINDATTGMILKDHVVYNDRIILYKRGLPVTERMLQTLKEFNITEIDVEPIVNDLIDMHIAKLKANRMIAEAAKNKGADALMLYVKKLSTHVINSNYGKLADVVYDYDYQTYYHSVNVANLALMLGTHLRLKKAELDDLIVGALIHDIGKTFISSEILNKPSKLTREEYDKIKEHPILGYNLVKNSSTIPNTVKAIILEHHENWDGTGYPYHLTGRQVSRFARIIHICDVYEAMCSKRPYKNELDRNYVREEMLRAGGILYDPFLIKKFFKCVPMYFIGERVTNGNYYAVVIDTSNGSNPEVLFKNKQMSYNDFIEYTKSAEFLDVNSRS